MLTPMGTKVIDLVDSLPTHPTKVPNTRSRVKRLVVHTTDWVVTPLELAEYDIKPNHISDTGCPTITYHMMIDKAGRVYKTAEDNIVTWHVGAWNPGSYGIALIYKTDPDFERKRKAAAHPDNRPTDEAMESLHDLLADLCEKFELKPKQIFGHRELKGTGWIPGAMGSKKLRKSCPGRAVDLDLLRKDVAKLLQRRMRMLGYYLAPIDGDFGPRSREAYELYLKDSAVTSRKS